MITFTIGYCRFFGVGIDWTYYRHLAAWDVSLVLPFLQIGIHWDKAASLRGGK